LANDDRARGRKEAESSTRKAFANLWSLQHASGPLAGRWDWIDFELEPWESKHAGYYGGTLVAIAAGMVPGEFRSIPNGANGDHVVALAASLKKDLKDQNLFNRAWALGAATVVDGVMTDSDWISTRAALFAKQRPDGGWQLASLGDYVRTDGSPQD